MHLCFLSMSNPTVYATQVKVKFWQKIMIECDMSKLNKAKVSLAHRKTPAVTTVLREAYNRIKKS